jgi:imidazolonepropionase-like amidohydrolase
MIRRALACLAMLLLGASPPRQATTLIAGARVFDGTGTPAQVRDVLIVGDRIARIARRIPLPAGAALIDAAGMTLLPGLHDLHIHTRSEAFESTEALDATYAPYLTHGITAIDEFSVSGAMLDGIRAQVAAGARVPHLNLAIRFGVPQGHGTESAFTNAITYQPTNPAEAHAMMARALQDRPDLIKVFADGWRYGRDADRASIDQPTLAAIVSDAHAAGLPVVTHTVTLAGAKMAARAGVDAVVHGIGDAVVDAEMIRLMKRHAMAYVPTLAVYEPQQDRIFSAAEWAKLAPEDRAREERRRAAPALPIPEYEARRWEILQENVRRLKAAGIPIGIGTDSGIGGVYHGSAAIREILWLTRLGFTPAEALRAATSVSARIIGQTGESGRIARGLRADLTLVAGAPDRRIEDLYDVRRVIVSGREVGFR